jgi:HEAT repeat protein
MRVAPVGSAVRFAVAVGFCIVAFAAPAAAADVGELTKQLQSTTGEARLAAIDALTDQGSEAAPAAEALAALLTDGDEAVRGRAARALGAIGPAAAPAVEKLAAAAKEASPKVRSYALYALGMIGTPAQSAFPAVAEALNDADPVVRREAVKAMGRIKPPLDQAVPALVQALEKAQTAGETMPALHALAAAGAEAVPRLIQGLDKPEARYWACRILAEIGPPAKDAVPALTKVLGDERTEVRREAAIALGRIGPDSKSAAPKLIELLADADSGVRSASLWALLMSEAPAADVLPKIQPLLEDQDEMVRVVAHWGAAKLDPNDQQARRKAIVLLLRTLRNDNPRIRAAAAHSLVDLRSGEDEGVMAAFIERLTQQDGAVIHVVGEALVKRGESAVPRLLKALERKELQGFVMGVLGRIGPPAKAAVPQLMTLSADPDAQTRAGAVMALGAIAGKEPSVVERLKAALDDKSSDVRLSAVAALSHAGLDDAIRPAIEKLTSDPDPKVAEAAKFELAQKKQ